MRVTVLELPARWNGAAAALGELDALLAAAPTDLAIVPEQAFTGYVSPRGSFDVRRFAEPLDGPTVGLSVALAERHATTLVVPLVLREDELLYNASVVVNGGGVLAVYRKRHPWIPEQWASEGTALPPLFTVAGRAVTIAVCYDAHFVAHYAADVLARAELLVFPSAWVDEDGTRVPLLASLARQFDVAVANANWGEGVVAVPGQGDSCILDRHGRVLAMVPPGARRADATLP